MEVVLLNQEQVTALQTLNTQYAMFCVCDHDLGPCVAVGDFDAPAFHAHEVLLKSWNLPVTTVAFETWA